jgi:hypothetical protein
LQSLLEHLPEAHGELLQYDETLLHHPAKSKHFKLSGNGLFKKQPATCNKQLEAAVLQSEEPVKGDRGVEHQLPHLYSHVGGKVVVHWGGADEVVVADVVVVVQDVDVDEELELDDELALVDVELDVELDVEVVVQLVDVEDRLDDELEEVDGAADDEVLGVG